MGTLARHRQATARILKRAPVVGFHGRIHLIRLIQLLQTQANQGMGQSKKLMEHTITGHIAIDIPGHPGRKLFLRLQEELVLEVIQYAQTSTGKLVIQMTILMNLVQVRGRNPYVFIQAKVIKTDTAILDTLRIDITSFVSGHR